jgi:hypothetical protein
MGEYVISDSGALEWQADPQPDVVIEHPLGETPAGHDHDAEPEVDPLDKDKDKPAKPKATKK